MKKLILGIAMCMIAISAFGRRNIIFDSSWKTSQKTQIFIPVGGYIGDDNDELYLEFLDNLGSVIISITDSNNNIIYQEEFNVEKGKVWTISLRDYAITSGVISISDGKGNYVWGNF